MAVEIPVVVDIFGAFENAAKNVKTAITPLESAVKAHPLGMSVVVDIAGAKTTLSDLFSGANASAENFKIALAQVEARINKLAANGGFSLKSAEMRAEEAALLDATMALEQAMGRTTNASTMMARVFKINMQQAETELAKYAESLNFLTKQQNFTAKGTNLYANREKKIAAINAKIKETRAYLATCSIELDKITQGSKRAGVAMGQMVTPAQQMAAAWERGHMALSRYNSSLGITTGRLGMLLKSALQLVALHSVLNFVRNIRQVTSEFELQRVALGGIIQDTAQANELFRQIKAAAIQSPFEIKDLISFTKQLSAYRIETDKLFDVTMRLADVSAGLGVDMSRLVLAYGQVRAASVLRGQELRQFTEAGIPLVDELAKKFSELENRMVTTGEVFKLISERAVPFKMIEEIFNDMTDAGGIFYKMQEKQSETLWGKWMKLKDAASIMYDEMGRTEQVHAAMEGLMGTFMNMLQNWRDVGKVIGAATAALITHKVAMANAAIAARALTATEAAEISALELNVVGRSKVIASLFGEVAATKVQVAIGNAYVGVKRREIAATNLFTKALWRSYAALLKNPYAIAIALVAALGVAIWQYVKASDAARISTEDLQKSIDGYKRVKDTANDIEQLCDAYDELSAKADKTVKEQRKLTEITNELGRAFPTAIQGIKEETKELNINTDAIRNRNKAIIEGQKATLERNAKRAEAAIAKLEKQQEELSQQSATGMGWFYDPNVQMSVYGPLPEKELEKVDKKLTKITLKINELRTKYKELLDELNDTKFDEEIGPQPSQFLGDAWRLKLSAFILKLTEAQRKIIGITDDTIAKYEDQYSAMDAIAKMYNEVQKKTEYYGNAVKNTTGDLQEQNQLLYNRYSLQGRLLMQILEMFNSTDLIKTKTTRTSYTEDPFIQMMKDRISFMKDFKKGYDDLNKTLSKGDALAKQAEIMETRGLAIGINVEDQKRAATGLSDWYQQQINEAFEKAKSRGATGKTVTDFLSQQIKADTNRGKTLKAFQQLIQSLFDAKTDLDTTALQKRLEDELKAIADRVKRSESARNFFNDIFDSTGDEEIARSLTVSVYGDVGSEFSERIQETLDKALKHIDAEQLNDELKKAIGEQDFDIILKYIDRFPKEWQEQLKQMASDSEKFHADQVKQWIKDLEKVRTYGEKRVQLAEYTQKKIAEIEASDLPQADKDRLVKSYSEREAKETSRLQYEAFKDSKMYISIFEKLDTTSYRMLKNMREQLEGVKSQWKNLDPTQIKELQGRLDELGKQLAERNPFKALMESWSEYQALLQSGRTRKADEMGAIGASANLSAEREHLELLIAQYEEAKKKGDVDEKALEDMRVAVNVQKALVDAAQETADAAQEAGEEWSKAGQRMKQALEGMSKYKDDLNDIVSSAQELMDTFASESASKEFSAITDGIKGVGKGLGQVGKGFASFMAGDLIGGALSMVAGVVKVISSIAKTAEEIKAIELEKTLTEQERQIKRLERAYDSLGNAIADAFSSEYVYIYNQQMQLLQAKIVAIEKEIEATQAALDTTKSAKKKAEYQDQLGELNEGLESTRQQIKSLNKDFQTFILGTDLTSAARDFAKSWIDAYKSYSSTTAAMKEKFREMIDNMVVNSLAAKLVESVLQPIFKEIDDAAGRGKLTELDIATISAMTVGAVNDLNTELGGLMQSLASFGINMRGTGSSLTGISKDIANASEESILGLAAGINTQNYYMSYMPTISQNVALIASLLGGSGAVTAPGTTLPQTANAFGDEIFRGQMSRIDENIAVLVDLVRSVRSVKQSSTNTHVIAVAN